MSYWAPELFAKEGACFASDLWAVGCILDEVITGRQTYVTNDGDEVIDVKKRVLNFYLARLPKEYSRAFRELVWCLLRKNPEERPTIE